MASLIDTCRQRPLGTAAALLGGLVFVRLIAVLISPLELGPDEAQYWRWSREFDWGYYSKPPLVGWVIGASTTLFGNSEWGVRILTPLTHGCAALCLFLLGRSMLDQSRGIWAAAIYLLMPGVWMSSTVMSTDAILLPLWSLALWRLWVLRSDTSLLNGAWLGLAVGFALMAKYAALYFLLGTGLAAVIDPSTRRALLSTGGIVALGAMLLVLSPNLLWNAANDFATVGHTGDNANWNNATLDPANLFKFIGDQMGVFGPLALLLLGVGIYSVLRGPASAQTDHETTPDLALKRKWLLCFILPPILIIAVQAVISRAHANWAATAYPAASLLVASFVMQPKWRPWIIASQALGLVVGILFLAIALSPSFANAIGADNALKRARGWQDMTIQLAEVTQVHDASAILVDEREPWHAMDFYGEEGQLPPLRIWRSLEAPHNFAEETASLQNGEDSAVIVAIFVPQQTERILLDFSQHEAIGERKIQVGPDRFRHIALYLASGFNPVPRDAAYFETYPDAH